METTIHHEQNIKSGIFYIKSNCDRLAFLSYLEHPDGVLNLNHTYVSNELRGNNIAAKLVETAIDYARTNHLKLIAVCPYVVKYFEKHPEMGDVL